jgi:hypothetical protein
MAAEDSDNEEESEQQGGAGDVEEEPDGVVLQSPSHASEHGSQHSHQEQEEEEEKEPTEEDVLKQEASIWLQRTIRAHAARRRALFTPVWVLYPSVVSQTSWGYQSFFDALDVQGVKHKHGFEEQIGMLDAVLEGGLGELPHLFKKELSRPMVQRRTRTSYLKGLIEFCLEMGAVYLRWGRGGPAEFMFQSVETLCLLPPCLDMNATRTLDACNFRGKTCYLVRNSVPAQSCCA